MSEEQIHYYFFDSGECQKLAIANGMTFGRKEECDVIIDDEMVSGQHFKIEVKEDDVFVIDLESSNKTYLNDNELKPKKRYKLNKNDVVRIGDREFSFNARGQEKLSLPDASKSLRFDSLEAMEDKANIVSNISYEQTHSAEDKRKETFNRLKEAKKYLNDLEESKKEIASKIELRESKISDYEVALTNVKEYTSKLAASKFKTIEECRTEVAKSQDIVSNGTKLIEEFVSNINDLEKEVFAFKEKIKEQEKKNKTVEDEIQVVREEKKIFKQRNIYQNQSEELAAHITELKSLQLEEKLIYIQKESEEETKKYKELQADYGVSLYGVKKRKKV